MLDEQGTESIDLGQLLRAASEEGVNIHGKLITYLTNSAPMGTQAGHFPFKSLVRIPVEQILVPKAHSQALSKPTLVLKLTNKLLGQ